MQPRLLLQLFHRAQADEDIFTLHRNFVSAWIGETGPFGLPASFEDDDPVMPEGELVVVKHLIIPGGKNRYSFKYKFRSEKFLTRDASAFDDVVTCQLEIEEPQYSDLLHVWLPKFAVSFKCYRAQISMSEYAFDFTDWGWNEWSGRPATNPAYHRIKNSAGVDIDGRNNIFTLHPAMFWDEELCINALGFGAAEVERRIKNDASHVELINGGVHIVLSTKLQMSFEDCVEMNEHFGRLLDIGGY